MPAETLEDRLISHLTEILDELPPNKYMGARALLDGIARKNALTTIDFRDQGAITAADIIARARTEQEPIEALVTPSQAQAFYTEIQRSMLHPSDAPAGESNLRSISLRTA